jgi:hypothetical protein
MLAPALLDAHIESLRARGAIRKFTRTNRRMSMEAADERTGLHDLRGCRGKAEQTHRLKPGEEPRTIAGRLRLRAWQKEQGGSVSIGRWATYGLVCRESTMVPHTRVALSKRCCCPYP